LATIYPSELNNNFYDGKWYGGGEVKATVNTRNSEVVPTRGFYAGIYSNKIIGINKNTNNYGQLGGNFSFYTDFLLKKHVIIAASFGADHNFGDFRIPQAQYLGFKQNLRGFRYQRFTGRSRAYNNTELRINFGDVNFYLFKGPFGVLGFHDVGRVWADGENSDTWHEGYGGGIWLAPFNRVVIAALLTSSKEEQAFPIVTLGFQF
jgi:outer membrane protein assembly factor BamA